MAFDVEKIEQRIDRAEAATTQVSATMGGVQFRNMLEIMESSKLLSLSGPAIPKWLQGNPGGCWAVIVQAIEWGMSPIAVARMSFEVNGVVGYMSQLIHAVVEARAPLKGRLRGDWQGEDTNRTCTVTGHLKGEEAPFVYTSPPISKIKVKNSPLWQGDPDQQLWYYSTRAWARRYCPDVLMGIYSKDEIEEGEGFEHARDITPDKPTIGERLKGGKDKPGFQPDNVENGTGTKTKIEPPKQAEKVTRVAEDEIARGHEIEQEMIAADEKAVKATGGAGDGHASAPPAGADDPNDVPAKLDRRKKKDEPKAETKPSAPMLETLLAELAEVAGDINTLTQWQTSASVKKRAMALSDEDRVKFVEAREQAWEKV